jgi:hypothetical protein
MCKRLLGFCAGPESHTFYACVAHRVSLDNADVLCFEYVYKDEPTKDLSPEEIGDDIECDLCREG